MNKLNPSFDDSNAVMWIGMLLLIFFLTMSYHIGFYKGSEKCNNIRKETYQEKIILRPAP